MASTAGQRWARYRLREILRIAVGLFSEAGDQLVMEDGLTEIIGEY